MKCLQFIWYEIMRQFSLCKMNVAICINHCLFFIIILYYYHVFKLCRVTRKTFLSIFTSFSTFFEQLSNAFKASIYQNFIDWCAFKASNPNSFKRLPLPFHTPPYRFLQATSTNWLKIHSKNHHTIQPTHILL